MSLRRSFREGELGTGLDMTPTADMVFSMVLFLILTQNFLVCLPLELPRVGTGEPVSENNRTLIGITSSGTVFLNNVEIPTADWPDHLRQRLAGFPATFPIFIEAHKLAPSGILVEMLDEMRLQGRFNITFLAQTRETRTRESASEKGN